MKNIANDVYILSRLGDAEHEMLTEAYTQLIARFPIRRKGILLVRAGQPSCNLPGKLFVEISPFEEKGAIMGLSGRGNSPEWRVSDISFPEDDKRGRVIIESPIAEYQIYETKR